MAVVAVQYWYTVVWALVRSRGDTHFAIDQNRLAKCIDETTGVSVLGRDGVSGRGVGDSPIGGIFGGGGGGWQGEAEDGSSGTQVCMQ